jgi:glutamyl-tRNA synthetase
MGKVITRFAPSPTGFLHGGNYRTAVFAYLFAKKMGGDFIVRIEDTDKERSKKEYEENILETLAWLKLTPDHLYRQSEHAKRHGELIRALIAQNTAYVSKEEGEGKRSQVIRFRNPGKPVTFVDTIRGPITMDTTDLGDFVIARSEEEPVFHFAVVVDDADEGVTHVIRGEDHISNTPRQILIQEALGFTTPTYAHLPLVLGSDRSKLSKRRGAKALTQYRQEGYIAEALINYLALLGWHPENNQEIFTMSELVNAFDISRIQKGAGIFDEVKLSWFNHEHLRRMEDGEFTKRMEEFLKMRGQDVPANLMDLADLMRERYQTLAEAADALKGGEFDFMGAISYSIDLLSKGAKADAETIKKNLVEVEGLIQSIPDEAYTEEGIKAVIFPYATAVGRAGVLWPMRVALSGKENRPTRLYWPHS